MRKGGTYRPPKGLWQTRAMSGDAAPRLELTYDEYLALERSTGLKHEWVDGVAYAMAGGTPAHSRLSAQMIGELLRVIGDDPCGVHTSDLKIRPERIRFASYPDVAVVCDEVQTHPDDRNAVLNPTVLVEVLSDSTEGYDREEKFSHYRRIPSLREYLLVSQYEKRIEHLSRNDDGSWTLRDVVAPGVVALPSIGCSLELEEIYKNPPG